MRKILTVLCLALALCLLCGYALAANDPYGNSNFDSVAELDALKGAAYKDIGTVEGHEDLTEKTKTAKCGEYVEVDVYGTTTQGGETKTVHAKAYVILKAHDWKGENTTNDKWDVAPTCTEKGKNNKQCANCKATEFVADIPALGHAFELAFAEGKEPTCTKDGAKILTCIRCGVTKGEEIKVDKLAHSYKKLNFTEPKCAPKDQSTEAGTIMNPGKYYYTCEWCGKKEVIVDAEGKETEVAPVEVTLEQYKNGFTDKYNTVTKPIKAPEGYDGHDWTEWLPNKAKTCTEYAKERRFCKRCTMEEWREDKEGGYAAHDLTVESDKPFNCKTTADDVKVYCKVCTAKTKALPKDYTKKIVPEVVKDNVTVSPKVLQVLDPKGNVVWEFALDHSWKVKLDADKKEVRTKATCTKAATVTMVCEFCDTPERVLEEGKPLGHDLSDWKKETDTADSTVWNRVCNRCHEVAETYVGKVPPCRESEHNYVFDDKYVCGEEKVYKYTCSVCGMATTKKEKFDHDYSKNVVKVATCKEDGIEIWTCKLCNETLVKYPSHTEVEHTWIDVPAVEKTCTVDGKTAGKVCSVCGVIEGCEVVKAPGQHTYKVVEGKAATCTEKGLTSSVKCSVCGETLMAATEIEALDHDFVEDAAVAATCTKAGKEAGKHCTRCDYTEGGKEIKALGHKWDEGKVTKEATPEEKGEMLYTCTVCGEKRTEEFEFEPTEDPKYDVKDAEFDGDEGGSVVSGKVTHDPYTKVAETTYARVTFFMADGTFVAFATVIDEDGNFEAMTSGEVVHIAIQITNSTKVRPGEFDFFGSTEFDVE